VATSMTTTSVRCGHLWSKTFGYTKAGLLPNAIGDCPCVADHIRWAGHSDRAHARLASDVDLLRDFDGVIDLDAEVAHGALDLRVSEQELHRSQISCSPVDRHRLRATQRVRAEFTWIESDALSDRPRSGGQSRAFRQLGRV